MRANNKIVNGNSFQIKDSKSMQIVKVLHFSALTDLRLHQTISKVKTYFNLKPLKQRNNQINGSFRKVQKLKSQS